MIIIASVIYLTISLLTDKIFFWEQVVPLTPDLVKVRSIVFMFLEGLFIFRGIYFLRKHSFQKRYLFELLFGLFLVIESGSKLYIIKNMTENFFNGINLDINKTNPYNSPEFIAGHIFLMKGEIIKYSGKTFEPTEQDYKDRTAYIKMQSDLEIITQGIYNALGVLLSSILLGLLWPLASTRKEI